MAPIAAFGRFWTKIYQHILARHLPAGMVSWRFCWPHNDPLICQHQAFWQYAHSPGLPRQIGWAIDGFIWLKWLLWFAWVDTWRSVWANGLEVRQREGLGLVRQFCRVGMLACLHTVPPWETYEFRLYRTGRQHLLWTYVFDHEVQAYHQWRSRSYGRWQEATALLGDKVALTRLLEAKGLPVARILQVVSRGDMPVFSSWLKEFPRLFCKRRSGSRGEGAFVVERSDDALGYRLQVFRKAGGAIAKPVEFLRQCLLQDDYLIQPKLENHPLLTPMTEHGLPVELRVITCQTASGVVIDSAFFLIPIWGKNDVDDWLLLPITVANGLVGRMPEDSLRSAQLGRHEAVLRIFGDQALPGWATVCQTALKAHAGVLLGAHTIAWDFLLTPDGPRLLEGNSGWGTSPSQVLGPGLLAAG